MGIIKAGIGAIGGGLGDQWLEAIEANNLDSRTMVTTGKFIRNDNRSSNKKGTSDVISNGSVIHVYPNQFMMLVENGKVIDYTAEEGTYVVENSSAPSFFNGQFGNSLKDVLNRVKFGGTPSYKQTAIFINLQELAGIKFGTRSPLAYFDNFYNAELRLRAHGTYSLKITNPLLFYTEVVDKSSNYMTVDIFDEKYRSEFLQGLRTAMSKLSLQGFRVSHINAMGDDLGSHMSEALDHQWTKLRGLEIQAVGIGNIDYDEASIELIDIRNKGAMLQDASIAQGYAVGAAARGVESAGSNAAGAMTGFMGVGMGMQSSGLGNMTPGYNQDGNGQGGGQNGPVNPAGSPGSHLMGGVAQQNGQDANWQCSCGHINPGKFCSECGNPRPAAPPKIKCDKCGYTPAEGSPIPKFCPECGDVINDADVEK